MHTWVYGKETPGWYIACWRWDEDWAEHLKEKGYIVSDTPLPPEVIKVLFNN